MQDSSPMVLFVGQVGTDMRGREAFQEVDYRAVFGTLAKWAVEIDDADRLPEILARAWTTALGGRPGPVVVALPEDMLTATTDIAPLRRPAVGVRAGCATPRPWPRSAAMLRRCRAAVVLIGGANWSAAGRAALCRPSPRAPTSRWSWASATRTSSTTTRRSTSARRRRHGRARQDAAARCRRDPRRSTSASAR